MPPETPIADIETGLGNLFEGDFAGFDRDSKSYTNLIGWLRDEFRDLAGKVKTVEQDKQVLASQSGADAVRIQQELEQWKKQTESAEAAEDGHTNVSLLTPYDIVDLLFDGGCIKVMLFPVAIE